MKPKPYIHPATPRRLQTAFRRNEYKYHKLATAIGVNVKYVHRLIHDGKEPPNPEIRRKLFLPKKPKAAFRRPYIEPPEHIKWWRCLKMHERHTIIFNLWKERSDANQNHPKPD